MHNPSFCEDTIKALSSASRSCLVGHPANADLVLRGKSAIKSLKHLASSVSTKKQAASLLCVSEGKATDLAKEGKGRRLFVEDNKLDNYGRCSEAYNNGVIDFLDKAFAKGARGMKFVAHARSAFSFLEWIHHGEDFSNEINFNDGDEEHDSNAHDDMDGLLHDTFRDVFNDYDNVENVREGSNL
ncbi:hypothetical protein Dimus_008264 [Dionaea muscipula]